MTEQVQPTPFKVKLGLGHANDEVPVDFTMCDVETPFGNAMYVRSLRLDLDAGDNAVATLTLTVEIPDHAPFTCELQGVLTADSELAGVFEPTDEFEAFRHLAMQQVKAK